MYPREGSGFSSPNDRSWFEKANRRYHRRLIGFETVVGTAATSTLGITVSNILQNAPKEKPIIMGMVTAFGAAAFTLIDFSRRRAKKTRKAQGSF
jgi:hypothetical protein